MNSTSVNYFSNGQIVYAQDSGSLFKATVTPANYIDTFEDTVAFKEFSFNSGSFVSASFDGTKHVNILWRSSRRFFIESQCLLIYQN